eukprot:3266_1
MSASQHGAPHESNEQSALAIEQFERGVKEFVVQKLKKPKYQSYILLWMLGLYLLFFTVGIVVSPDVQEKYDQTMNEAGSVDLREFQRGVMMADDYVYAAKTWFWRFNSEQRAEVYRREVVLQEADRKLAEVLLKRDKIAQKAKKMVGVWSEHSVEEARSLFWMSFARGKGVAKRATWWDIIFGITLGRDESMTEFLVRLVMNMLINLTFGMIYAVIAFLWRLWDLIWSYGPSLLEGTSFFMLAALASVSCITSVLVGAYGTVGVGAYVGIRNLVMRQERLGPQSRSSSRPFLRQRQHMD